MFRISGIIPEFMTEGKMSTGKLGKLVEKVDGLKLCATDKEMVDTSNSCSNVGPVPEKVIMKHPLQVLSIKIPSFATVVPYP